MRRIPFERCPICDGKESLEFRVASCAGHALYDERLPDKMRWVKCKTCDHVYVDGYLDEEAIAILFRRTQPNQTPGEHTLLGRPVAAKIVEDVSTARGATSGRWLDVGFGAGALLATAAEYGYEAVGIDARKESVERMRSFGFECYVDEPPAFSAGPNVAYGRPFDVISMADVLEHGNYPLEFLAWANRRLVTGGALFVSCPNTDAFAWRAMEITHRNPYWSEIEHVHNFGRAELMGILRSAGFQPVRYGISQRYLASMELVALKEAR